MYSDKKFIGQKIREFRKKNNLSQAELAEKVGLSDKHIGRIEAGKYFPNFINFLNILNVLNISLTEFGLNVDTPSGNLSDLLKLIYSSSDKEICLYLKILKTLKEEVKI